MPSPELVASFDGARLAYERSVRELIPILAQVAGATVADVLPGARRMITRGGFNEDWLRTLRIQQVLDTGGAVLFDVDTGHDDPVVEETIDEVNVEFLDLLVDLAGDDHMGVRTMEIDRPVS